MREKPKDKTWRFKLDFLEESVSQYLGGFKYWTESTFRIFMDLFPSSSVSEILIFD